MCAFMEAWRDFVSSIEDSRESSRARVRAAGASGRASRMLEVASTASLTSVAIPRGESLLAASTPADCDPSASEAKVRSTIFLDDLERALRPAGLVSICKLRLDMSRERVCLPCRAQNCLRIMT